MATKKQNATQPLFYRSPEPLDFKRHKGLGVGGSGDFGFAQAANAVMLTAMEFALASRSYPVVFAAGEDPMPLAVLGIRNQENLFVENGVWTPHTYIPAYIRRYPFAFLESQDQKSLILCVDVDADAIQKNGAVTFFDEKGEPSEFTRKALEFCRAFQIQFNMTRQLSALLKQHDLLVSRQADITTPSGEKAAIKDFLVVDEEKLNALPDEAFLELRKAGVLPALHFHLMSLANFRNLAERAASRTSDG